MESPIQFNTIKFVRFINRLFIRRGHTLEFSNYSAVPLYAMFGVFSNGQFYNRIIF